MIYFGKEIDLSLTGKHLPRRYHKDLKKQNERARGLWNRLYKQNQPGVLLADEVGKGKTYVALAVALSVLASKQQGRVLVLTHSCTMARIWQRRWLEMIGNCLLESGKKKLEKIDLKAHSYRSIDELADDADSSNLPPIAFASYETLKKYGTEEHDAGLLFAALKKAKSLIGLRFNPIELRALIKDIVDCDLRSKPNVKISTTDARHLLKCIDRETRIWKDGSYPEIENILDHMQAKAQFVSKGRFDLLIVDEAHKLEGTARHRVVSRLLHKRFNKSILVTATPFALSVRQFQRRLLDFRYCHGIEPSFEADIEKIPFDDFRRAVASGADFNGKDNLEQQLRKYMVRETWNHDSERVTRHWKCDATAEAIFPTLLLERLIDGVLQSGQKTHIASRRESLCSSWPAARKSMEDSPLKGGDQDWGLAFDAVVKGKAAMDDPKLQKTVKEIASLVEQRIKVVVFTQRVETSRALKRLIEEHPVVKNAAQELVRHQNRLRRHVEKVAAWLDLTLDQAYGIIKVMAHSPDRPSLEIKEVKKWWKRHDKQLRMRVESEWSSFRTIIGRARRLPIVIRYPGESGSDERNIDKFNLPSSPLVLITTPKAQEGIDLHNYCHHVVLFDLTWNPAVMEQRIGRVHRIGGNRRPNEKVEVIYCYQKGTYEEVMAKRIQERCKMMRVLLGAGQWLDQDREVRGLDKYMMTFPA